MKEKSNNPSGRESTIVRNLLIAIAVLFFISMLLLPLFLVFAKAFEKGAHLYLASITDPMALEAVKLTLLTILIVVPVNTLFGLAVAWAVTKFKFKGKKSTSYINRFAFCHFTCGCRFDLCLAF